MVKLSKKDKISGLDEFQDSLDKVIINKINNDAPFLPFKGAQSVPKRVS